MAESAIVKYLCANYGSTNRDELVANCVFGDATTVNEIINNRDRFANAHYNGEKRLIAKTALRLCRKRDCPGCNCLHICKTYLYGECQFVPGRQATCSFSHDLHSQHNSALLRAHDLADLDKKELCVLLLQNDMDLLPSVCFDYNNRECQASCKRIHICENYLRRNCICSRAHDFYEPQPFEVLQKSRIPNNLMVAMKPLYINKKVLSSLEYRANREGAQTNHVPARDAGGDAGATGATCATGWIGATGGIGGIGATDGIGATGGVGATGGAAPDPSNPRAPRTRGRRGPPQKTGGTADKTEICLFFLKGNCIHTTEKCFRAHYKLPYSWEVLEGHQWTPLATSESIEEDYCNPKKTYSTADVEMVCFDTMTRGLQKARRLSSTSSVLQPTFLLTTEWLWYWEDEFGNWNDYDSPTNSSTELEQKFLNAPQEEVEFTVGSQAYTISFQDMIQTNKRYGTKRVVRRRPRFLSSSDVQTIKTSRRPSNGLPNFQGLPRHWDKTQVSETGHKKVLLQESSNEYKEVELLFRQTMIAFDIVKIERIQNKSLWDHFQLQRDQMKKRNGGRNVAERKLFHGTDSKYIDAICCSNFDWRICGTHGTAYGKGSYFATDASYSHNYTGNSTSRSMFVSRVLVGHHTKGSSSYVRPPSKDGGDTLFYDSCADSIRTPSIFVVFDRPQIYPEFLLTYKEQASAFSDFFDDVYTTATRRMQPTPVMQPTAYSPPPPPQPYVPPPQRYIPPSYPSPQPTYTPPPPRYPSPQPTYTPPTPTYPSPQPKKNDSCVVS